MFLSIVKLVAVSASTTYSKTPFSSFQTVMECRRKPNEDLSMFVDRFRGLAARNLIHAHASFSSETGKKLAITLLKNAVLNEGTLTNAKSNLVKFTRNCKDKEVENSICVRSVPIYVFTDTAVCFTEIDDLCSVIKETSEGLKKKVPHGFYVCLKALNVNIQSTVRTVKLYEKYPQL